jgi:hypothetical protein
MELFSKRYEDRIRRTMYRSIRSSEVPEKGKFIKDSLRNRLKEQIKYMVRSKSYLEPMMYVNNATSGETYLHTGTLSDLSMREVGYDLDSFINLKDLSYREETYQDAKFFDLIELIIIFSKKDRRAELVSRLEVIFKEEGQEYSIHGHMIVSRENDGLRSTIPLLKEKNLQIKIKEYYEQRLVTSVNFEILAQISADIIQLLFSSPKKRNKTKEYAEELCEQIASRWTDKTKVAELKKLLSETVKNSKELANQIQNVRHTDRTTIPVEAPDLYKLIANKNINIAELVILSLPEKFISSQDPEDIKLSYLAQYGLSKESGWAVKDKPLIDYSGLDEINPDDIPF